MKRTIALGAALFAALLFSGCSKIKRVSVNSVADLAGKKVGCQAGTTGETYVQENIPTAKLRSFKTAIDAALSLKNGAIDAIVLDELPSKEIVKRNPELSIVNDTFATEEYAIAVKKGNRALLDSINSTIHDLMTSGTYEVMVDSFMPVDGDIRVPDEVATSGSEIVKMGTNAAFPPFEYTEGSTVVGFDVTMSQFIARDLGKKLQVVDMAFDSLIAALQADAIDFIAAGMTATEERRQNVDFSDPYYLSNQVIIVRK